MITIDHRTDIRAYASELEAEMFAVLWMIRNDGTDESGHHLDRAFHMGYDREHAGSRAGWAHEWADSELLDVEHTARIDYDQTETGPEETRLLLTCGGPTVQVVYSHRYGRAELFHSWGQFNGDDRTTWHLDPDLVEEFVAVFAPHPCEA